MPYTQYTLASFTSYISDLLDDPGSVYWPVHEIEIAIFEGLRVWGALTNYWRARGAFNLDPAKVNPYYDMSQIVPNLRTRITTLDEIVQGIQFMLLEPPSGISGVGMSGQVGIQSILDAIQYARNRFIIDTHLPLTIHDLFGDPPAPQGTVTYSPSTVYLHRTSWQDSSSQTWTNLWRQDEWAMDRADPDWTVNPASPICYSESDLAPLQLQLQPAPINAGHLDGVTVDSEEVDLTDPTSTFNIPDEWIHAVKYAALSNILQGGMIADDVRGDYAETRYQQAVTFAKDARSILRAIYQSRPLNISSLASLDAASPFWRNQVGAPSSAGIMYDMLVINPGMPDRAYGMEVDVVQSAPIPSWPFDPASFFMPLGPEDLDALADYVTHILLFKCGGKDFTSTMSGYDSFMKAVTGRKAINTAKVKYFAPIFGKSQDEWARRPDKVETNA